MVYHDVLTGLPNRAFLLEHLPSMLAGADRHNEKVALLFLNLDHFKNINDSLGHASGDLVLKKVAGRLEKCSRKQDVLIRLGADEFVAALGGIRDGAEAAVAAERIRKAVAAEFGLRDTR